VKPSTSGTIAEMRRKENNITPPSILYVIAANVTTRITRAALQIKPHVAADVVVVVVATIVLRRLDRVAEIKRTDLMYAQKKDQCP